MRWLVGAVLLFAVACLLIWFVAAPAILKARARSALVELGFQHVRIEVESLGLGHVALAGIALGRRENFRIERIVAEFNLAQILRGRVGTVIVERAVWEAPAGAHAGAEAGGEAGAEQVSAAAPFDEVELRGTWWVDTPLPDPPFDRLELRDARVVLSRGGAQETVHFDVVIDTSSERWAGQVEARAGDQILETRFELAAAESGARGEARVRAGDAEMPLELAGPIEIENTTVGRRFRGAVRGEGEFRGAWDQRGIAVRSAAVALDLDVDLPRDGGGRSKAALDFAVREPRGLRFTGSALPDGMRDVEAQGSVSLRAEIAPGGTAESKVDLELRGLDLQGKRWSLEGLEGALALHGLPPSSSPEQELRWKRLVAGKIEGEGGFLRCELRADRTVRVSEARWQVGAGSIAVHAFELDPTSARIATRASVEQLALAPWLELLSGGRATGEGEMNGEFAVRVALHPLDVELGEGRLLANGAGTLRLADTPEVDGVLHEHLGGVAATNAEEGRYDALVKDRIVQSLKDFSYRELTADLVPIEDDTSLRLHLMGKGRKVPQELDVRFNLNGVNALLDLALGVKGALALQPREAETRGADPGR